MIRHPSLTIRPSPLPGVREPRSVALCRGAAVPIYVSEIQEAAMKKSDTNSENRAEGPDRSDSVVDRRMGVDRRDLPAAPGQPAGDSAFDTNLERRRGPGRRRTDFMKSAEEGEMTHEQFMFVMAIDAFKRVNNKTFPTWTDVLEVIRKLGYRKTMPSELKLGKRAEDWTERADAPCGVFKTSDPE